MIKNKRNAKRRKEKLAGQRELNALTKELPPLAHKYKLPEFLDLHKNLFPTYGLRPGSLWLAGCPSKKVLSKEPSIMIPRYEGEMADREAVAQKEVERKKTMVAPMWNKGTYQYVGDCPPEIIKTLGRKI